MLITLAAGKCLRCLVFWAYSVHYSQVGSLVTEAHVKVICQSIVGVKAIKPEHSCSQECISSEQMKEKLFAINFYERPKTSAGCVQCSAWSPSDHYCVMGVGGLQGCPDCSCHGENKEHVSCISSGSHKEDSLWQVEEFQTDSLHFCLLPVQPFPVP